MKRLNQVLKNSLSAQLTDGLPLLTVLQTQATPHSSTGRSLVLFESQCVAYEGHDLFLRYIKMAHKQTLAKPSTVWIWSNVSLYFIAGNLYLSVEQLVDVYDSNHMCNVYYILSSHVVALPTPPLKPVNT